MLSINIAQALKDAGLEWEPKYGDQYYTGDNLTVNIYARPNNDIPERYILPLASTNCWQRLRGTGMSGF